jgi:hypothetical protein
VICTSCEAAGEQFIPTPSKLMPGVTLYLCNICFHRGVEPRFAVVLTGRKQGIDRIAGYLLNHKYVGNDILAVELV